MRRTQDDQSSEESNHDDVDQRILQHLEETVSNKELWQGYGQRTIHLRWRFCFVENSGGRICFEGLNQTMKKVSNWDKRQAGLRRTHHRRVQLVDEWNEHGWRHDDQEKVRKQEVGRPEGHLDNLDHELTSRL